jgi:HD superfamily phosphohydrolase
MITMPEKEIIDTRDFQRLRRVRQLGAACVVYPTALHTRFDHSLGTLEMAWRMVQSITGNQHNDDSLGRITPRQKCLARISTGRDSHNAEVCLDRCFPPGRRTVR